MLSPAATGFTFRDVDTSRVVRDRCGRHNHPLTRGNLDFCTIHTPYYDYYPFDIKQMKKE